MKVRKLGAILLAGALMTTPVVTSTAMAESSAIESADSTQSIVDESGNLIIEGTTVTGLTEKGKEATEIVIPEGVTTIGSSAFYYYCKNLTSVTIPDSVTSIGSVAFSRCEKLTNINIPKSVTTIGDRAFDGTPWLSNKQEENPLVIINNIVINGKACEGDVVIPNGVTNIANGAFLNCGSIKNVTISDSVTKIGYEAFGNCENLENIIIGNGVTSLGVNETEGLVGGIFEGCSNLKTLTIGDSVKDFWTERAFLNCSSLESINVSEKNNYFSSADGVLFNKDKTELIKYPATKTGTSYTIPESVTVIDDFCFESNKNLKNVYIHKNVTEIFTHVYRAFENPIDVYYGGTQEQLTKALGDNSLENVFKGATIHYNSAMPEETPDTPSSSTPRV